MYLIILVNCRVCYFLISSSVGILFFPLSFCPSFSFFFLSVFSLLYFSHVLTLSLSTSPSLRLSPFPSFSLPPTDKNTSMCMEIVVTVSISLPPTRCIYADTHCFSLCLYISQLSSLYFFPLSFPLFSSTSLSPLLSLSLVFSQVIFLHVACLVPFHIHVLTGRNLNPRREREGRKEV